MKIFILCSDKNHPVFSRLLDWQKEKSKENEITLVNKVKELRKDSGDILSPASLELTEITEIVLFLDLIF